MKRPGQWEQSFPISSDDSSDSDSGDDGPAGRKVKARIGGSHSSKDINSEGKKRHGGLDLEALSRHGYKGAPSVLKVPPPRVVENKEQDWSWCTGERANGDGTVEESYEQREKTRAAVAQGEKLLDVQRNEQARMKEKKASFSQKEKRKRDLGQASRGKNYVEEEKRLLRDRGFYSGFDA